MKRTTYRTTAYQQPAQQQPPGAPGSEIRTPARQPAVAADVAVPALQAAITGMLFGAGVVAVARPEGAERALLVFGGVWLTVSLLTWLILLADTRALLRVIERLAGEDLDGDGQVGQPAERVIGLHARPPATGAADGQNTRLADFVRWVAIHGTATAAWEAQFGRDEGNAMRDQLIANGWARKRGTAKNSPWDLLATADEIIDHIRVL